ncbi:diacylglycerol kinase family lipid kinase [Haliea sp. E1-2-M8]|uniref:diacylglycerol/lipid kinase family protein n=1 Tax=Haliea sp. E1-2-M8 TaxID=3064706 RepID=UPI0027165E83|nr:diacylglycerol kinase family protein [Haliea sp. E1-2-M8]MDO8861819.1 diacylglycerol kinase family lipid kinase [Haliea sp. E1-2-M8]
MAGHFSTFVVVNPTAGAGSVARQWQLIDRLLRSTIPELAYAFTEAPGHATLLTREALRAGWEMVVSVGGDGTLNEVINGFCEQSDPHSCYRIDEEGWISRRASAPPALSSAAVLGMLPLGTGSDFRRSIGLSGSLRQGVEMLAGRETRHVDLGQIGYLDHRGELATRFFVNISSAGFSGRVVDFANRGWKGGGGRLSFFLASLRALASWSNLEMAVRLDDGVEIRGRMLGLIVANGGYFGGGMWIAPGASLDDGQFEVVVLGDLPRWQLPGLLPRIYRGTHVKDARISCHHARQVSVRLTTAAVPGLIDLDGEQPGCLPAMWNLQPRELRLKVRASRELGQSSSTPGRRAKEMCGSSS